MCTCGETCATQICNTHIAFTWTKMSSYGMYMFCTPGRHINQVPEAGCDVRRYSMGLCIEKRVFYTHVPSRKILCSCAIRSIYLFCNTLLAREPAAAATTASTISIGCVSSNYRLQLSKSFPAHCASFSLSCTVSFVSSNLSLD